MYKFSFFSVSDLASLKMDFKLESNETQVLLGHDFNNTEHFNLIKSNSTFWSKPSISESLFHGTLFLILETVGNFLLFCMVIHEKCGMDWQKRTVTNQLLSSVCISCIFHNIFFMPIFMVSKTFGVKSKNKF